MKLVLIDGGPASGKNTLGELIVKKLNETNEKAVLLDLDTYVERYNPRWIWDSEQQKELDQLNARKDIAKDIDEQFRNDRTVIVIGERFLSKEDVTRFMDRLESARSVQLFHLNVPFELREQRLYERGLHSLIDLAEDQSDRDAVKVWPGYVYANTHTPEEDAGSLIELIKNREGEILVEPKQEKEIDGKLKRH